MYKRLGSLVTNDNSKEPLITTECGKVYQITYIVAFVWEKLDGNTTLNSINEEIKKLVPEDSDNSSYNSISQDVVKQLLSYNLAEDLTKEISADQ